MYVPYDWQELNLIQGTYTPSPTKKMNNAAFEFWERSLFQRACSTLDLKVPKDWEGGYRDFLYYCLFKLGFVMITEYPEVGKIFNPCTLKGHNVKFQPTSVLVCNPYMKATDNKEFQIGENCELLKLTPDYRGIWDIITRYAEKLAGLDRDVDMSIDNSKTAFLVSARDKTSRLAIEKALDLISEGKPVAVLDKNIMNNKADEEYPIDLIDFKIKENYLLTDLLRDQQTILNNFDAEVGIPTIPYQKAERMVTEEAESRQIDATSRSLVWFDTLKSSIEIINKHYGEGFLDVERRFEPMDLNYNDVDVEEDDSDAKQTDTDRT